MKNFAINGFGRIGRLAARVWHESHQDKAMLAAINTSGSMDLDGWAHLLKYDTSYGTFPGNITTEIHQAASETSDEDPLLGHIIIGESKIPVLAQREPGKIPWSTYDVNLVVESTGAFRTEDAAKQHLHANGAKQVLLSSPGKGGEIETVVLGVTETSKGKGIYSSESCTTNCVAPVISVLQETFGIQKAFMTTTHSYTHDQNLQDGSHKDLRRARAAATNIIPTTTGAALATTRAIPELEGKFGGMAIRVPTIVGSLTDITAVLSKKTTVDEINQAFIDAAQTPRFKRVLGVTKDPIVSSDVRGSALSALVDLSLTAVMDGDLVKIFSWYDNELGFTHRLVETALQLTNN